MHFPWKKAKGTRLSQLISGLHQSPKRGGSLVVETGFPTSLIDLFVKNRDRLRKSSKRNSNPQILTSPTHLLSEPPRSYPNPPCNEELQSPDMYVSELVLITRENDDEKIAFHLVFKISLVVALAVSTTNLAVWIMMVALLLMLIEFAGTRFLGFLRPESKTLLFYSWIRKGLKRWDWEQRSRADELVVKQQGTEFPDPCGLIELEDEIKMRTGRETEIITCKSERSRSARIKTSLINKFVPKKLRHGKRKSNKKDKESSNQVVNEEQEEDESETEEGDMVSTSDQLLQVESEMENVRKGNSGYVILFFIIIVILAGLIGGRGVALLLTLVCCLILIYIGTQKNDSDLNRGCKT